MTPTERAAIAEHARRVAETLPDLTGDQAELVRDVFAGSRTARPAGRKRRSHHRRGRAAAESVGAA